MTRFLLTASLFASLPFVVAIGMRMHGSGGGWGVAVQHVSFTP